jgi:tRNA (cmo5U34)-methyltransferase
VKSTPEEIRARFDDDVERFSNLETGQTAAVDAAIALQLVAEAAVASTPHAARLLDIGCGAGNFALRLLQQRPLHAVTLIDLSRPMLDRAAQRISAAHGFRPTTIQGDVRDVPLGTDVFDIVLAGAVLHHLRSDSEWEDVFSRVYQALSPGGSFWIFDMVSSTTGPIDRLMWRRYGEYLVGLKDETHRDQVFAYIEKEDTPRPLSYQLDLLRTVGFATVEILHKHANFAAFGALR